MPDLDHAKSPLDDGRDIVIYPRATDWGFRLPAQHTITLHAEDGFVYLATPDHGGGFRLDRTEDAAGELRVFLGFETSDQHAIGTGGVPALRAYAFPPIQVELERLQAEFVECGGSVQDANAWARGATYGSHTEMLRAKIRELRPTR